MHSEFNRHWLMLGLGDEQAPCPNLNHLELCDLLRYPTPFVKIRTSRVTLPFDLLTWKRYVTHRPSRVVFVPHMNIIYEKGNVNAKSPRRYRSRSKVIACCTPSQRHLKQIWTVPSGKGTLKCRVPKCKVFCFALVYRLSFHRASNVYEQLEAGRTPTHRCQEAPGTWNYFITQMSLTNLSSLAAHKIFNKIFLTHTEQYYNLWCS